MSADPDDQGSQQGTAIPEEGKLPETPAEDRKKFKCRYCGLIFPSFNVLGSHIRTKHKDESAAEKSKKVQEESKKKEEEIFAKIRMVGPEALYDELRTRLEELLNAPGIADESRTFVLQEWDRDPAIRSDFNLLMKTMTYDGGVKPDKAMRIVEKLWTMVEQFKPALEGYGGAQRFFYPVVGGPQQGYPGYPSSGQPGYQRSPPPYGPQQGYYGQPQRWPDPYGQPPPFDPYYYRPTPQAPSVTKEDVRSIFQQEMGARSKNEDEVEYPSPVMGPDGEVMRDNDGQPYVYNIKVPRSILPLMLMNSRGAGKGKQELPPEVMERLNDSKEQNRVLAEKLEAMKEQLSAKERDDLKKEIATAQKRADDAINMAVAAGNDARRVAESKVIEGYRSDSYRFLGQSIDRVGGALERFGDKWGGPGSGISTALSTASPKAPIAKEEVEVLPSAMEEELRKRGLIG